MSTGAPATGHGGECVRVLYLLDSTRGGGGAERIAVLVLTQLDPHRYDRTICITRYATPEIIEDLRHHGVEVLSLARKHRYDLRPWFRLIALGRQRHFHIIHAHKHGSNVWAGLLKLILDIPVFFAHEHSWPFKGDPRRLLLDRLWIAKRATRLIAVSSVDRDAMIRVEKIDPRRIVVLPNGIPDPDVGDADVLRTELSLPPNATVITCVGARPEKRVERVLAALAALRPAHSDLRLLVVGPTATRKLHELAEDLGLKDAVRFLGLRHDISTLLNITDVGVIASEREGSPLAVLEYMAAGCGIVATGVGGIPDMIRDGKEGLLVEPGDGDGLVDAIRRLVDDPALRRRLGVAARERQQAEFSLRTVVERTESLYEEILDGVRGAGAR